MRISGYEKLAGAVRQKTSAPIGGNLLKMVNHDSLRRQDEIAYREAYRDLPGSRFEIGKALATVRGQALQYGGSTPLFGVAIMRKDATGDGRLRLVRHYRSEPATFVPHFGAIEEAALIDAAGWLKSALPDDHASLSLQGVEDTVIDPDGMLISERKSTLHYAFSLKQPSGDPVPFRVRETRKFTVAAIARGAE